MNFASAAAGILDNTGQNFVGRIPFNQQIKNFEQTLDQLSRKLGGAPRLAPTLARSIFYVGMGSNDYLNNYLMPNYNTRNEYNGDQYSTLLVQQYAKQLNTLYGLGARRFVIAGVGSMACIPNMRARSPMNVCSPDVDDLIIPFNNKVKAMVNSLNANRPNAKFIYVDNYAMISEILRNPWSYGTYSRTIDRRRASATVRLSELVLLLYVVCACVQGSAWSTAGAAASGGTGG